MANTHWNYTAEESIIILTGPLILALPEITTEGNAEDITRNTPQITIYCFDNQDNQKILLAIILIVFARILQLHQYLLLHYLLTTHPKSQWLHSEVSF